MADRCALAGLEAVNVQDRRFPPWTVTVAVCQAWCAPRADRAECARTCTSCIADTLSWKHRGRFCICWHAAQQRLTGQNRYRKAFETPHLTGTHCRITRDGCVGESMMRCSSYLLRSVATEIMLILLLLMHQPWVPLTQPLLQQRGALHPTSGQFGLFACCSCYLRHS